MAIAANEIGKFRDEATRFIDRLRDINAVLDIVEAHGADDTARQAFFQGSFGEATDNPDLTWTEFASGVVALRAIRTEYETQRLALAKLLK